MDEDTCPELELPSLGDSVNLLDEEISDLPLPVDMNEAETRSTQETEDATTNGHAEQEDVDRELLTVQDEEKCGVGAEDSPAEKARTVPDGL